MIPTHTLPDPDFPRYSIRPFPAYRFLLGENPHPTVDPEGHSFGKPHEEAPLLTEAHRRENETYLYGVDLYNYAYWWEAHEAFEGLWADFHRNTPESDYLQGLIKIAASFYKWQLGDAPLAAGA